MLKGLLASEHRQQFKQARKFLKSSHLAMHVGSVAIAIEALETLLTEKGVIRPDELMARVKLLTQEHYAKGENIPAGDD